MKARAIRTLVLLVVLTLLVSVPGQAQEGMEPQVSVLGSTDTINFQGRLTDSAGNPLTGAYDLRFSIYDAETGGTAVWGAETHNGVGVEGGLFNAQLGSSSPLNATVFDGGDRWLAVEVWNGAAWEALAPRLQIGSAAYAINATTMEGHGTGAFVKKSGDNMTGPLDVNASGDGVSVTATGAGFKVTSAGGHGVEVAAAGGHGVHVSAATGDGVHVAATGDGVEVASAGGDGLHVSATGDGVEVASAGGDGLRVQSAGDAGIKIIQSGTDGVFVGSASGDGVHIQAALNNGIEVDSSGQDGVRIQSAGGDGVEVAWATGDGMHVSAAQDGVEVESAGGHGVHVSAATGDGVHVAATGDGVEVDSAGSNGLLVSSATQDGVHVTTAADDGFHVEGATGHGVHVGSATQDGVHITSATGDGVEVESAGSHGISIGSVSGDGINIGETTGAGIRIANPDGDGVYVTTAADDGFHVEGATGHGVHVGSATQDGVHITSATGDGIEVESATNDGVHIESASQSGVHVKAAPVGLWVESGTDGIRVQEASNYGLLVESAGVGFRVKNATYRGIEIEAPTGDGILIEAPTDDGIRIKSPGGAGLRIEEAASSPVWAQTNEARSFGGVFLGGGGIYAKADGLQPGLEVRHTNYGDIIVGYGSTSKVFEVDRVGNVWGNSFNSPAADFAEMLPAEAGLEPGDVLAIGKDGRVTLASAENASAVIGVYSTQPAFLGGSSQSPISNLQSPPPAVPVAIVGVVPAKVSAENGPIRPNDPLTASSTPGYATKATPLFTLEGGEGVYAGGTILGRALEGLDSGEGMIQVLLQLR